MRLYPRFLVRFLVVALVNALVAAGAVAAPTDTRAKWNSGADFPQAQSRAELVASLDAISKAQGQTYVFIGFDGPITPQDRTALAEDGLHLQSYVGGNSYFARLAPGWAADSVAQFPTIASVREIERAWKLHPLIIRGAIPDWAVVSAVHGQSPIVAVYILFHPDVNLAVDGVAAATKHGATIRSFLHTINGLVIELPESSIDALADEDAVMWIEPPLPQFSEMNDSNRVITQTNQVQAAPYDLDGSGIHVLVYDGGRALASHNDFGGRLTTRDNSPLSDHATHVSGTVGGDGSNSGGNLRGMAPAVIIESYGFQWNGQQIFLYSNPGDIESDYNEAINTFGVAIANNSIGTNTATNGWPCSITGDYGVTSALIDSIVTGSLGAPFRIVWANGNERQSPNCGNTYFTTAPPACAKNHITVGALNSNNDSMTSFSSWGPCDDGRLKPDITAPGCQSSSDFGVTSASSSGGYTTKCGTSMASPTVTGMLSLLLQDYRARINSLVHPLNSTLKALLAHTAEDLGNTGPDYQFGYGAVRIRDTIDFMRTESFLEDVVDQGEDVELLLDVSLLSLQLRITLAWDDAPAIPPSFEGIALVNDLDLIVTSPTGVQHFPWTLNPGSPASPAVQTQADHTNNIEQVLVNFPESGTWTVIVRGFSVPQGPQSFSLCLTPILSTESCDDGMLNQGEDRIDCGGPCPACECVDDATCDDGLFCNGGESCDSFGACTAGTPPCENPTPTCLEDSDTCVSCVVDADCDDNVFCNGVETCMAGACESGPPEDCDDGVACTVDSCNVIDDVCENAPDHGVCDNGQFCDGVEVCDAALGCITQTGSVPDCDDGVGCTLDSCDEGGDTCVNAPNDAACDNGQFCDGVEVCDSTLGCITQPGSIPDCDDGVVCTADSCDEAADLCEHVPTNALCDNDLFCDGVEVCDVDLGCVVVPGTVPGCGDGVSCTVDTCNEATDSCDNLPDDQLCDNGLFCDGVETCDTVADCITESGSVPDCDDEVGCTVDACNEATDSCDNLPDDQLCDNGLFCDGVETCDAVADCITQPGSVPDCDDGVGCTVDTCDEDGDQCVSTIDDSLCPDDGLFCNGDEFCDALLGCLSDGTPCNGVCDEVQDVCQCDAPLVQDVGGRYVQVQLLPSDSPIAQAIRITPTCPGGVTRYVGAPEPFDIDLDGFDDETIALVVDDIANAAYHTPQEWGELYIYGESIAPDTEYDIASDCGLPGEPELSDPVVVRTWLWGDAEHDDVINLADAQIIVLVFQGSAGGLATLAAADLEPCVPNRSANLGDVQFAILAFQGDGFEVLGCASPCP